VWRVGTKDFDSVTRHGWLMIRYTRIWQLAPDTCGPSGARSTRVFLRPAPSAHITRDGHFLTQKMPNRAK
jgi:hypothetical protein